jgi:MerR family redox-sensitive transcriptional activator SoxR
MKANGGGIREELSVGEVAARSGVAVSAIHFYEAKGLIRSRRNPGNQRRYPREVLRLVAVIKVCPLRNPKDRLGEQGPGPRLLDA